VPRWILTEGESGPIQTTAGHYTVLADQRRLGRSILSEIKGGIYNTIRRIQTHRRANWPMLVVEVPFRLRGKETQEFNVMPALRRSTACVAEGMDVNFGLAQS